jgi:hypothetical protein
MFAQKHAIDCGLRTGKLTGRPPSASMVVKREGLSISQNLIK